MSWKHIPVMQQKKNSSHKQLFLQTFHKLEVVLYFNAIR